MSGKNLSFGDFKITYNPQKNEVKKEPKNETNVVAEAVVSGAIGAVTAGATRYLCAKSDLKKMLAKRDLPNDFLEIAQNGTKYDFMVSSARMRGVKTTVEKVKEYIATGKLSKEAIEGAEWVEQNFPKFAKMGRILKRRIYKSTIKATGIGLVVGIGVSLAFDGIKAFFSNK